MANRKSRRSRKRNQGMNYQTLEAKRCLASVGWDGAGQGSVDLSYYLGDAPSGVEPAVFESTIESALQVWSDVADITFTETAFPGQNDSLDITSGSIDGSGGILAQAYFPDDLNSSRIAGDILFDASENWEVGNDNGSRAFDLMHVAVHEIGHSLGLEHSHESGSVLNDTVSPTEQFTALDSADRTAILELYAAAPAVDTPVDPGPTDDTTIPADPDDSLDPDVTPTVDTDPTDTDPTDQEDNNRWRRFRRGHYHRFRIRFFIPNDTGETETDPLTNENNFNQVERFTFRFRPTWFFRGFR